MPLILRLFLFSILLVTFVAKAGGSFFPIKIISIDTDGTKFILKGAVIDESLDSYTIGCSSIRITGNYANDDWIANQPVLSLENHQKAIGFMVNAHKEGEQVNIGYLGQGFFLASKCSFFSKGMFYDEIGVYSIYSRI